jgi:hypothetical protein
MKVDQVRELIRVQSADNLTATNDHSITLEQALVTPRKISVIVQLVKGTRMEDQKLNVWLVGQEDSSGGYRIIMSDDGLQFGLAHSAALADEHVDFVGWYGDLVSAFLSM